MDAQAVWPLGLYVLSVAVMLGGMVGASWFLGERHREHATGQRYESGILPTGGGRLRFAPQYYLVAMMFVIFDVEAAFLFAWAVAAEEVGWLGYVEVVVFVVLLLAALVWLWRVGALDWAPLTRRRKER